jgi:hypothetical protein
VYSHARARPPLEAIFEDDPSPPLEALIERAARERELEG